MKTYAQKEHGQMPSSSDGFELRATVAIRIIVDRVELEQHPLLTTDQNGARRRTWQSIAAAAVENMTPAQLLPERTPAVLRQLVDQRAAAALQTPADRKREYDRLWKRKRAALIKRGRAQRLKAAAATTEAPAVTGTRQAPTFKEAQCAHCGKAFTRNGPRQIYCKRKPCVRWVHNAARNKNKQRRAEAAQKGGAA